MPSGADAPRAPLGHSERARSESLSTPVLLGLIWLVGGSAALLLYWGSKLTFLLDDWEFLLYRPGFTTDAILLPHGEHISIAPILIYKALQETLGMGSAFPFRVVSTAFFLLSAVLMFAFLRRRVGQWLALIATAVVLFLGAGWEDLLWAFQVGYFGSMAAGIGALLALERHDRRGGWAACGLLSISIVFSSLGIPFLIGAAIEVLTRTDRWRRLYILVVPAAIYAAWWLGWGHTANTAVSFSNLVKTPSFVLNSIASTIASALGLASPTFADIAHGLGWVRPVAALLVVLLAWWLLRGRVSFTRWAWVCAGILGSFWILSGLNQIPGREPSSSRYQYVGVVLLFLLLAELLRRVEVSARVLWIVSILGVASIVGNVIYLHQGYAKFHSISKLEKADLGAIEIARGVVEPGFVLSEDVADTAYVHVEAAPFLLAAEEFGSPAYSPAELGEASTDARFAADKVLFSALRLAPEPLTAAEFPDSRSAPAAPAGAESIELPAGRCLTVPSRGGRSPLISLPPAGVAYRAGSQPIEGVDMTRFAVGEFPIQLEGPLAPGRAAEIATPADGDRSEPWKLALLGGGTTTVCGLSS